MRLLKLLLIVATFLAGFTLRAQLHKTRPGDEPYTPSKLEWAALQLQSDYGVTDWTPYQPVMINYFDSGDGATVTCLLQYTPDVTAQVVKVNRDTAQTVFDKYVTRRGWTWLTIRFDESLLPATK